MAESDRIAALEAQLRFLQQQLEEERSARVAATQQLQGLVQNQRRQSNSNRLSPGRPFLRTVTPDRRSTIKANGESESLRPSSANRFHTPQSSPMRTSPLKSSGGRRASTTPSGRETPSKRAAANQEKSALEIAWQRFSERVSGVLTEEELWLVSAETLGKLLDSFGVIDDVERAQVEAQWTIYQRAIEESVASAGSWFGLHNQDFNLRQEPQKSHFSRRTPLRQRTPGKADPNTAGDSGMSATSTPRKGGGVSTSHAHPHKAVSSNPNEVHTKDEGSYRRPSYKHVTMVPGPDIRDRPQGIAAVPQPESKDIKLRGIRSAGSTRMDESSPKSFGLKTSIAPADEYGSFHCTSSEREGSRSFGIRTFSQVMSPDQSFPTSPRVRLKRDSLTTESSLRCPQGSTLQQRRPSPVLSSRQSRTPFALDE